MYMTKASIPSRSECEANIRNPSAAQNSTSPNEQTLSDRRSHGLLEVKGSVRTDTVAHTQLQKHCKKSR